MTRMTGFVSMPFKRARVLREGSEVLVVNANK